MKVHLHKVGRWYEAFLPVYEKGKDIMAIAFSRSARLDVWSKDYIEGWPLVTDFKPKSEEIRNSFLEIFTNYSKYILLIK
jgi:hypothetical protein